MLARTSHWIAVALALGGATAYAEVAQSADKPASDWPRATATHGCGPIDQPAIEVALHGAERDYPALVFRLWQRSPPLGTGFALDGRGGEAQRCEVVSKCTALPEAQLLLREFNGSHAAGELRWREGKESRAATFSADTDSRPHGCG